MVGGKANMKSNRLKFLCAALVVTLLATVAAISETTGPHGHWHRSGEGMFGGPGFGFMLHSLDLTDAQKTQAKQIMTNEKATFKPLMQQMRQNRLQERQIIEAANFDQAQASALAAQQSQTMTQLTVERMKMESQIYQILTPDQKTKLNTMLDKRTQRFQQHQQQQNDQQQPNQ
jgi:periplasmic protein CpxP/Spy